MNRLRCGNLDLALYSRMCFFFLGRAMILNLNDILNSFSAQFVPITVELVSPVGELRLGLSFMVNLTSVTHKSGGS